MAGTQARRPLVSVVTPCRNAIRWLPSCRDSVRRQSYDRVEHIVVDGGSEDGTVDLLRSWNDITWVSERDSGQSGAINKGFRLAQGEVLTWLNADDELVEQAVAVAVDALVTRRARWVVGGAEFRENGKSRFAIPRNVTSRRMDVSNEIPQPSCFFTRDLWEEAGGLDEGLHLALDLDLWYRFLAVAGPPVLLRDVLAVINLHEEAKTRAVGSAQWWFEIGAARAKNGRLRAAGVDFGRSAAATQQQKGCRGPRIAKIAGDMEQLLLHSEIEVPATAVRAGALVTLAATSTSPLQRLRWLARPDPWLHRSTRRELGGAALTRLRRISTGWRRRETGA